MTNAKVAVEGRDNYVESFVRSKNNYFCKWWICGKMPRGMCDDREIAALGST